MPQRRGSLQQSQPARATLCFGWLTRSRGASSSERRYRGRTRRQAGDHHRWVDRHRIMRVNVHGVVDPSQLAARHMMSHGGGAILMTASTSSVVGYRRYADYNASKGALLAMMRTWPSSSRPRSG